jgi:hypothetical protein
LSALSIQAPRLIEPEHAWDRPSSHCTALFGLNLSKNLLECLENDRKARPALAKH